jgi:flagellum-specific peptidoglycan hydrolase FlgJ
MALTVGKQEEFFKMMRSYADSAGKQLDMPGEVILAQWAWESNYGQSDLAKRAKNFGGIKYTKNADFQSGAYGGYNSISRFVDDYVRVMSLSYYAPVRDANSPRDTAEAFSQTPYAEDKNYSSNLLKILGSASDGDSGEVVSGEGINPLKTAISVLTAPVFLIAMIVYFVVKKRK